MSTPAAVALKLIRNAIDIVMSLPIAAAVADFSRNYSSLPTNRGSNSRARKSWLRMDGTQSGESAQERGAVGRKFRGGERELQPQEGRGGGLGRWVDVQRTLQKGG